MTPRLPGTILALLALAALVAGCGEEASAPSRPVAFSEANWPTLASDVSLAALRRDFPPAGDCVLKVGKHTPKTLDLDGCGEGRGGVVTKGRAPRQPACRRESGRTRCSASNGVSVAVWAPRSGAAIALLKATIESVDETVPDDAVTWGMWLEPGLEESKGSLTLAPPRRGDQAIVRSCEAGPKSAAMLGELKISKRTARHVAGKGVHIKMIERPSAVRSFSMSISDECREGRAGALRGDAIEPPSSHVQRFVLVIPNYYSASHRKGQPALLRGLLLEPRLYPGEKHNQLPETMLAEPEDPEASAGQVPLIDSTWTH